MSAIVTQNFSPTRYAKRDQKKSQIISPEYPIEPRGLIMTHITGVAAGCRCNCRCLSGRILSISAAGDGDSYNLLVSCWINNIQRHGQEKIRNQNRQGRDYHRFGRGPPHSHRAFPCRQSFVTADENDQDAEDEGF
jgi:hypothetical protein